VADFGAVSTGCLPGGFSVERGIGVASVH